MNQKYWIRRENSCGLLLKCGEFLFNFKGEIVKNLTHFLFFFLNKYP